MAGLVRLPSVKGPKATASTFGLVNGVREIFGTTLYSDLTIVCNGWSGSKTFMAHKIILHAQSSWFRTALSGRFGKTLSEDGATLTLPDDQPDAVQAMLQYMYTATYRDPTESPAAFAVFVYQVADKYDVPALRDLATSRFEKSFDPTGEVDAVVEAIRTIDEDCPADALWAIVIPKIRANMGRLVNESAFFEMVQEMPELNKKLLLASAKVDASDAASEAENDAEGRTGTYGGRRLG